MPTLGRPYRNNVLRGPWLNLWRQKKVKALYHFSGLGGAQEQKYVLHIRTKIIVLSLKNNNLPSGTVKARGPSALWTLRVSKSMALDGTKMIKLFHWFFSSKRNGARVLILIIIYDNLWNILCMRGWMYGDVYGRLACMKDISTATASASRHSQIRTYYLTTQRNAMFINSFTDKWAWLGTENWSDDGGDRTNPYTV